MRVGLSGLTMAEYFRDVEGQDVLLFIDNIFRFTQAGSSIEDIDLVIPHQANLRIITKASEQLGIPEEKVYTNIRMMGNVSSACIPVCLDELNQQGRLKAGMKMCFVGFGAGLTYGATLFDI